MRFFGRSEKYTSLPDQHELFALPHALCGYIEKRSLTPLGWRWRKRAVILNKTGHLIVYKNFLDGVGAVKPFIGQTFRIDASQLLKVTKKDNMTYLTITDKNSTIELRVKGEDGPLWAAKIFMSLSSGGEDIDWPLERVPLPLNRIDSKISKSSVIDETKLPDPVLSSRGTSCELSDIDWSTTSSELLDDLSEAEPSCSNRNITPTILRTATMASLFEETQPCSSSLSTCISRSSSLTSCPFYDGLSVDGAENAEAILSTKRARSVVDLRVKATGSARSLSATNVDTIASTRGRRFYEQLQKTPESGICTTSSQLPNIDPTLSGMSTCASHPRSIPASASCTEDVYKPLWCENNLFGTGQKLANDEEPKSQPGDIGRSSDASSFEVIHL
ncbi:hypothetical protein Tcan_14246 [Toxocara canis]|uniref:PH-15 domain-containing protein n=1 Tax=Toxocara canis TaxID=6265 RepID=A0A0B2VHA3_TOXCA|nr:hypothetical protein Tcan_14246 [Toxocara canis]